MNKEDQVTILSNLLIQPYAIHSGFGRLPYRRCIIGKKCFDICAGHRSYGNGRLWQCDDIIRSNNTMTTITGEKRAAGAYRRMIFLLMVVLVLLLRMIILPFQAGGGFRTAGFCRLAGNAGQDQHQRGQYVQQPLHGAQIYNPVLQSVTTYKISHFQSSFQAATRRKNKKHKIVGYLNTQS